MIPPSIEKEALEFVNGRVPSYLFGEAINAAKEFQPFTRLDLSLQADGIKMRNVLGAHIVPGCITVEFRLNTQTPEGETNVDGIVAHDGEDYGLRVLRYEPLLTRYVL